MVDGWRQLVLEHTEGETILTLDQAIHVRTQQLCGHWTAPERLAEAIAVIRQQVIDVSLSQYRKVKRLPQRAVKVETE